MKHTIIDRKYRFISIFDDQTGEYVRSGIIDENGNDTGKDPFMASFPHLIDVGICGSCKHASKCTVGCYQGGTYNCKPNMTLENYKKIVDECEGKCNQFALGGHGDPDCHENFEEILEYTRYHKIVPNFTTSGFEFNEYKADLCKRYCGAVAVSWYRRPYTYSTIRMLLDAGVTTNVHFVLSKSSIDEAIKIVNGELELPTSTDKTRCVNAVVFLLHKPVGRGQIEDTLATDDIRLIEFFNAVDNAKCKYQIGFDSCTIPGIVNFTNKIDLASTDTCEGGRFSMYITPDMYALPCSFDNQDMKYAVKLDYEKDATIEDAWISSDFNRFRKSLECSCPGCEHRESCMGGCPLLRNIVLCDRSCKELV